MRWPAQRCCRRGSKCRLFENRRGGLYRKDICCPVRLCGRMTIAQRFIAGTKAFATKSVKRTTEMLILPSAGRFTDYISFSTCPSSELLGYCRSSATRTGSRTLFANLIRMAGGDRNERNVYGLLPPIRFNSSIVRLCCSSFCPASPSFPCEVSR